MFILVILISFILLFTIVYGMNNCWRSAALSASIILGLLLVSITEGLSIFKLINFKCIALSWGIIDLILALILYILFKKNIFKNIKLPLFPKLDIYLKIMCIIAGVYIVATGLTAIVAAPNNYDSMTYHMARIIHWMQNSSIAHYPTGILRQLYSGPLAEFNIMHFQILSGGDRFANLVQWLAMLGSITGVSLIAKLLGANIRGQIFASMLTLSIPMGILQATSTQNDLVVSFWLVCFVYYLLKTTQVDDNRSIIINSFACGASLGLAFLTKGTAYIFALPFLVWFGISIIKKLKINAYKPILIIVLISVIINLGYWVRNYQLFGSPFSPDDDAKMQQNLVFTPNYFAISVLKNIYLQTKTSSVDINNQETRIITKIAKFAGVDVNDNRTNYYNEKFHVYESNNHEDIAANPIHFCLILISIFVFFGVKKYKEKDGMASYLLTLTAGALLFCFILKWQPWGSRLQLPLVVLIFPFVGRVLSEISKEAAVNIIILIVMLSSFQRIFHNETRTLCSRQSIFKKTRIEQYFRMAKEQTQYNYSSVANLAKINKCHNIGIILGGDTIEYPLLVLLRQNIKDVRVEYINAGKLLKNINSDYFNLFTPDAVISTEKLELKQIRYKNRIYKRKYSSKIINFYN
ncbi:MAG: glycosyltransferase family 39 protein [Candidatus Gastranaerophilaceae bacterium]